MHRVASKKIDFIDMLIQESAHEVGSKPTCYLSLTDNAVVQVYIAETVAVKLFNSEMLRAKSLAWLRQRAGWFSAGLAYLRGNKHKPDTLEALTKGPRARLYFDELRTVVQPQDDGIAAVVRRRVRREIQLLAVNEVLLFLLAAAQPDSGRRDLHGAILQKTTRACSGLVWVQWANLPPWPALAIGARRTVNSALVSKTITLPQSVRSYIASTRNGANNNNEDDVLVVLLGPYASVVAAQPRARCPFVGLWVPPASAGANVKTSPVVLAWDNVSTVAQASAGRFEASDSEIRPAPNASSKSLLTTSPSIREAVDTAKAVGRHLKVRCRSCGSCCFVTSSSRGSKLHSLLVTDARRLVVRDSRI